MPKYLFHILVALLICACSNPQPKAENESSTPISMSTTFLKIIPTSPSYVPDQAQQDLAKAYLDSIFKDHEIEFATTDSIEFIDQGENFESVSCNVCNRPISMEVWQEQMDMAYKTQFSNLDFVTPCQHQTTLNDIHYNSPAGFSKFVIRISEPDTEIDPENEVYKKNLKQLEFILGTPLKMIWARY